MKSTFKSKKDPHDRRGAGRGTRSPDPPRRCSVELALLPGGGEGADRARAGGGAVKGLLVSLAALAILGFLLHTMATSELAGRLRSVLEAL